MTATWGEMRENAGHSSARYTVYTGGSVEEGALAKSAPQVDETEEGERKKTQQWSETETGNSGRDHSTWGVIEMRVCVSGDWHTHVSLCVSKYCVWA